MTIDFFDLIRVLYLLSAIFGLVYANLAYRQRNRDFLAIELEIPPSPRRKLVARRSRTRAIEIMVVFLLFFIGIVVSFLQETIPEGGLPFFSLRVVLLTSFLLGNVVLSFSLYNDSNEDRGLRKIIHDERLKRLQVQAEAGDIQAVRDDVALLQGEELSIHNLGEDSDIDERHDSS
jgi:hypothetical protein